MSRLLAEEIEHYRSEGWVVPHFRLPARESPRCAMRSTTLIRANPGVRPEKLVSAHVEGDNGEGVRGAARSSRSRATPGSWSWCPA